MTKIEDKSWPKVITYL